MDLSRDVFSSKLDSLQTQGVISLVIRDRLRGENHSDLLTQGNESLLAIFNVWEKTGDDHKLGIDLIEANRHSHRPGSLSPVTVKRWVPEEEEEGSSPLGAFLHEKKKHHHQCLELKIELCGSVTANQDQSSPTAKS